MSCPANGFILGEGLIGIGHDLKGGSHCLTYRLKSLDIFCDMSSANFDLTAAKAFSFSVKGILHKIGSRNVEPTTFCAVDWNFRFCSSSKFPERKSSPLAAQIPKGGVDGRQSKARDSTNRRSVGVKVEIFPDALDVFGVSSNQLRQQMIFEQVEDRTSTGTDGVGVANACLSIFIDDGDCLLYTSPSPRDAS